MAEASRKLTMNILIHTIIIATFVLMGALPATAGVAPCARGPAALLKMADAGDVKEWRVKLDKFDESAKVDSKEAQKTAAEDLNKAWSKASDAAAKLETTSVADWESAKASFNRASDELAATWTKVRAELK
jgi:hypothetical protein